MSPPVVLRKAGQMGPPFLEGPPPTRTGFPQEVWGTENPTKEPRGYKPIPRVYRLRLALEQGPRGGTRLALTKMELLPYAEYTRPDQEYPAGCVPQRKVQQVVIS